MKSCPIPPPVPSSPSATGSNSEMQLHFRSSCCFRIRPQSESEPCTGSSDKRQRAEVFHITRPAKLLVHFGVPGLSYTSMPTFQYPLLLVMTKRQHRDFTPVENQSSPGRAVLEVNAQTLTLVLPHLAQSSHSAMQSDLPLCSAEELSLIHISEPTRPY